MSAITIGIGAEKVIAAEKGRMKIAVEVKSFSKTSTITEFYHALGQFQLYERALKKQEPTRTLYLAMPFDAYDELSKDVFDFEGFEDLNRKIIVLKAKNQLKWIE